jgi:hypothetical protein
VAALTAYLISIAALPGVSWDDQPRPRRFFLRRRLTTALLTMAGAILIEVAAVPLTAGATGALVALKRSWLS